MRIKVLERIERVKSLLKQEINLCIYTITSGQLNLHDNTDMPEAGLVYIHFLEVY